MKKTLCIIGVILLVVIVAVLIIKLTPKGSVTNDGNGNAEFDRLTYEAGFGLDIDAGEFPIDVEIEKGKLNIKIVKGNETVYEQTDIEESQHIDINIEKNGYYFMMLSGKKASGKIKYPVAESTNNPEVNGVELSSNPVEEEIVKNVIEKHFKENFDGEVEEVKFNSVKVYTKEEIEKDEMLKELELKDKDVAFEIDYELRIKEGTEDLMKYTAATGEIEGQWIKEKYNCGVARYDSEKAEYSLSDFGTSF